VCVGRYVLVFYVLTSTSNEILKNIGRLLGSLLQNRFSAILQRTNCNDKILRAKRAILCRVRGALTRRFDLPTWTQNAKKLFTAPFERNTSFRIIQRQTKFVCGVKNTYYVEITMYVVVVLRGRTQRAYARRYTNIRLINS